METVCGECDKEYSKNCQIKKHCIVHNKDCFQCLQCKPSEPGTIQQSLQACFSCKDLCKSEDAFYEWRCDTFICKKQFTLCDFSKELVTLPCNCQQQKGQVVAFMSNFCISCLRKIKDPNINEIRLCVPCINKNEQQNTSVATNANSKQNKERDNKRYSLDAWLKVSKPWLQEIKQQMNQGQGYQNFKKDQALIIQMLTQDIKKSEDQFKISQFTRLQLNKALFTAERDRQCIICNQNYTLVNKPMMICMQQHLICEVCFKQRATLNDCPLCKQPIPKSQVRVSRQRMRTLQLERIMSEKFASKYKRYRSYCDSNFQLLRYKLEVNDAQVQTQEQVQATIKREHIQQRSEPKQRGRKKQKL